MRRALPHRPGPRGGFTLVEIMISLALAGLVVAGAFELHRAFNRQSLRLQQISELQQSLRIADDVMSRMIRSAGAGMNGSKMLKVNTCVNGIQDYYPVMFSNKNVYYDPPIDPFVTKAPITNDGDPDWLRIIGADSGTTSALMIQDVSGPITACERIPFEKATTYSIVPGTAGSPACFLEIQYAGYAGDAVCPNGGKFKHPPLPDCYNSYSCPVVKPTMITKVQDVGRGGGLMAVFRVAGGTNADRSAITGQDPQPPAGGFNLGVPTLWISFEPPGGASKTDWASLKWQALAPNIENMQIALIRDDGAVFNSVDDPKIIYAKPRTVVAVKYTLVARSNAPIPGYVFGFPNTADGTNGIEDQPAPDRAKPDGYLRRTLTNVVMLRNVQ